MHLINPFHRLALLAGATIVFVPFMASPATAAITLDQFTIIAGGWQLEQRCDHLDADKHDALGTIAAQAEIDAVRSYGASSVTDVLAGAEQFGKEKGAACGDETLEAVDRAYDMAEQYALAITAEAKRKRSRRISRRLKTPQLEVEAPRRSALSRFGSQTEAYYLQHRCRHLPYEQALAFWKLIKKHHLALMKNYGAGAVNQVSRRAKNKAYGMFVFCGPKTRSKVYAGLHTIRADRSTRY